MDVLLTEQFEQAMEDLMAEDKTRVYKAITFLGQDLRYPGLHVKKMKGKGNVWEARVTGKLRMTFEIATDAIILRNVGEHDKVLSKP